MRKLIAIIALAGAAFGATTATSTADAQAASWKRCAGHSSGYTRGGWNVYMDGYRGYRMNCSSVRYAAKFLRKKYTRGWYPVGATHFWDGYVTWHCGAYDNGVKCWENSSGTAFKVNKWIY